MHTINLLHSVAIWPNLELKTRPKQLLSSLLLDIALPGTVRDAEMEIVGTKNVLSLASWSPLGCSIVWSCLNNLQWIQTQKRNRTEPSFLIQHYLWNWELQQLSTLSCSWSLQRMGPFNRIIFCLKKLYAEDVSLPRPVTSLTKVRGISVYVKAR